MRIGFVGCGRLGLPVMLSLEAYGGHEIKGYDISPQIVKAINEREWPFKENDVPELLSKSKIDMCSLDEVVDHAEIIYACIQTPHGPEHEGITRLTGEKKDFNYDYLKSACSDIAKAAKKIHKRIPLVVISTVLPGTMHKEIIPLLKHFGSHLTLVYNPFFPAMGTAVKDFLDSEFVLVGSEDDDALEQVADLYNKLYNNKVPVVEMSIKEAELTKVSYNLFITTKINIANTIQEICHRMDMNCDNVMNALKTCTRRIISDMYLTPGGEDGGGCHPRDAIAMSWLANEIQLTSDPYHFLMKAREDRVRWLVNIVQHQAKLKDIPIYIMGKTFKPESNLCTGSWAILASNLLRANSENGHTIWDPHVDDKEPVWEKGVYFIATKHECFKGFEFPEGSVVIDCFRFIPEREGVEVIGIGA